MNELEEAAYVQGQCQVYRTMLVTALNGLGRDSPEWTASKWAVEREEVVALLRRVCADHGDNGWPDDLHLGDVIENHLVPHLPEPMS